MEEQFTPIADIIWIYFFNEISIWRSRAEIWYSNSKITKKTEYSVCKIFNAI